MSTVPSQSQDIPNMDGRFRVTLDRAECTAYVDRITAHSGSGKPVTAKAIFEKLKALKVSYGADVAAIDQLVEHIAADQIPEEQVIVAKGDAVVQGKDGSIEWLFDPAQQPYLRAGQLVARIHPPTLGESGKNVHGEALKARPGTPLHATIGDGLRSDKDGSGVSSLTTSMPGKLLHLDGKIEVQSLVSISEDQLHVALTLPPKLHGETETDTTMEDILQALAQAKILVGIQTEKLQPALQAALESGVVQTISDVAVGIAPVDGVAAKLHWQVNPVAKNYYEHVVIEDQPVVRMELGVAMKAGKTVTGEEIPGKMLATADIAFGEGIVEQKKKDDAGNVFVECTAQWLGVLEIKEHTVRVRPCVQVSENRMEAVIELFARSGKGVLITSEIIQASLLRMGICVGIDERRISHAVARLGQMASEAGTLEVSGKSTIAYGKAPKAGVDERLELECHMSAGEEHEDGKMDFHERSFTCKFSKGDVVGRVVPAVPPEAGADLFGNPIVGQPAQLLTLNLRQVERSANGELIAMIDGSLLVCGNQIEITDLVVIEHSVSQETGNIHSSGSVLVKEYVQTGFMVESEQSIIVKKNLEGGTIRAKGSVSVEGGVRGQSSEIFTGTGDIQVGFVEQGKLTSAGSILVATNCLNSFLDAKGNIRIGEKSPKKGQLIGGLTKACGTIKVNILGSDACIKTMVEIDIPDATREEMKLGDEKEKGIQEELAKLQKLREQLNKPDLSEQQETMLGRVLKTQLSLETELHEIDELRHHVKEKLAETDLYQVIVEKEVFPGVMIRIFGADYKVEVAAKSCRFHWTRQGIVVLPR